MQKVKAISDISSRNKFFSKLPLKYKIIWIIGIKTGLRISDILNLRVEELVMRYFELKEQKTGKTRVIELKLSKSELKLFKSYLYNRDPKSYAFSGKRFDKPLSRVQVYRVFKAVAERNGIKGIGTHTMRKTFARDHFKEHRSISELQEVLNHKFASTTVGYIFNWEELEQIEMDL